MSIDAILQLVALAKAHAWLPIAAIVIGFFVRLTKDDAPAWLPSWARIPARWRPVAAAVLGQAAAVVDALTRGTPWLDATISGVLAAAIAVLGHGVLIEALRGGKEVPLPGFNGGSSGGASGAGGTATPGGAAAQSAGSLRAALTQRSESSLGFAIAGCAFGVTVLLLGVAMLGACTPAQQAKAQTVIESSIVRELPCVFMQAELGETDPGRIALACSLPSEAIKDIVSVLAARRAGMLAATAKLHRDLCAVPDAGAEMP